VIPRAVLLPGMPASYRSVRDAAVADVGRAIALAAGGAIAFAPVEYALTLASYPGPVRWASKLGLVALTAVLSLWLWLLAALALSAVLVGGRLLRAQLDPAQGRGPGWWSAPAGAAAGCVRPGVPRLWATVATALASVIVIQRAAALAMKTFKEPQLTAALIAVVAVVWLAIAMQLHRALVVVARIAAAGLAPLLGAANPLGRWRAAGPALAGLVGAGLAACWFALPQSRSVLPVRLAISALVIGLGMGLGALHHARRAARARGLQAGALASSGSSGSPGSPPQRRRALTFAGAALAATTATLAWLGAELETKYVAITASPALDRLIAALRVANDFDRDGFGSLLGEGDCAPLTRAIHPGAIDAPDNGRDENCDGHDFSMREVATAQGPVAQVPERFRRPWNVLLLTIDTLRYDRTTFGGYASGPKRRNTTPRLAALVERSVSFAFANAPSAGTMASIPAILTSKFFHSGIALDETVPTGSPPGILPENTTLPEIMKRRGYATGVVGSHVWWNKWGLEQGVDDYDNSIARTDDPFRVAAHKVTDHVLAWVSRQQGKRWFMWAHYIDPHGRYVAHPDVVDYGGSEPDLYDAEVQWTDQQVGRLLDELARLPSHQNTIVVITSDHGDSMGEHTVPVGTHGTALYRELLHVPLIFYIPDNRPRVVHAAVTPLDIVPTVAALCDIDVSDLSFEGKSLVPQLFYDGTDDRERIVFAETNAPQKERAAISERWKLIYYFSSNLYELYDLKADPWERTNLAPQAPPAFATMKQALQAWMDRVMYARDPTFNQAHRQISAVLLPAAPAPQVPTTGQTLDGITVLGITAPAGRITPGKAEVHVFFRVERPTTATYRFQLAAWPVDAAAGGPAAGGPAAGGSGAAGSGGGSGAPTSPGAPPPSSIIRSALRATADGAFASDRWKAGDHIRERFTLQVPADWTGEAVGIGLLTTDAAGERRQPTGAVLEGDPFTAVLGILPLGSSPGRSP
jgi:choline-sulfatase